jgi:hypothetical protein
MQQEEPRMTESDSSPQEAPGTSRRKPGEDNVIERQSLAPHETAEKLRRYSNVARISANVRRANRLRDGSRSSWANGTGRSQLAVSLGCEFNRRGGILCGQ